jgi:DeoR/GlpR family transcriptional regulator of sugar metabolism
MWINTYIEPPDVIIINAGTNLTIIKFVNNAKVITIEIEEVSIEIHHSIGKIEKYHGSVRRAYEIIMKELGIAISSFNAFQIAIKSVNDTAGPDGLVPTLLVFGAYSRLTL